ncbi:hypothetical protein RCT08_13475, partial [Escherichia marmotae]|nr:hypothetical protein [Escherichia marmotae]
EAAEAAKGKTTWQKLQAFHMVATPEVVLELLDRIERRPASIVQAQGIEIAINELVALSPRLDKRAAETLSMAVAQLRKLVKKQLQAKD